ncbi:IQ domain-containing protein IQM2 [Nicotiana tomentosiformis]|uniref:IQ domain-containing protein IQM2 n=1 Tax=Nicotiana tomentosiformis TaxID=4098 RepID=UPI00051C491A|nr:IQ domain-containing protein IQM2-like [Nicotiana tomentosiformis]
MGLSFSYPLASHSDLETSLESVIVKSIDFGYDEGKTLLQSVSFKSKDTEPTILQSDGFGKMSIEKTVSFRTMENAMEFSKTSSEEKHEFNEFRRLDNMNGESPKSPLVYTNSPKHEAALKLQKVYKSFRTRRKLADCAVLIEQSWWKLLDFAELKHSSISFFDLDKHETAVSRWSRARTRAAKVGKGLSKNGKAQKLALQHWLEAIDPRHRYGHNLHFYYVQWLHSQSKEPFFYWLDIGEGKEVNIVDKCPRWKLQQQCIKYLGPMERKAYEVEVQDGKLFYKETGKLLNTTDEPKGAKWIFVLSTSKTLYVGKKSKGTFQHSSFLAGGATLAAGRIVAEQGVLKAVWPHSGHYRPTPENFQDFVSFMRENNVDLNDVKLDSDEDEQESVGKKSGVFLRGNSSEDDLQKDVLETEANVLEESTSEKSDLKVQQNAADIQLSDSKPSHSFSSKLTNLQIPSNDDFLQKLKNESEATKSSSNSSSLESPSDGYETAEELFALEKDQTDLEHSSSIEELEESKEEIIPEESIIQRINSHKDLKSYQLGKQLSCKWSTGAGPRIGCLRDYPSQLQSHALEQVSLSPRSACRLKMSFPSRASTPTTLSRVMQVSCSLSPLGNKTLSCLSSRYSSPPYNGP